MTTDHPLPVAGVWRREWEEDPLGDGAGADRKTLVLWTQSQTSGVYVDIRIPAELIGLAARSRSTGEQADAIHPNPRALAARGSVADALINDRRTTDALLRQKSFAGVLRCIPGDVTDGTALRRDAVLASLSAEWRRIEDDGEGEGKRKGEIEVEKEGEGEADSSEDSPDGGDGIGLCTCFWRRDLDYQPPTGDPDVGVCASDPATRRADDDDGSTFLRESGADGSYAEGWRRLPGTERGPFMALRLISEDGIQDSRAGCWVRAGPYFAYAVGRPAGPAAAEASSGCPVGSGGVGDCVGKSLAEAVETVSAGRKEDVLRIAFSYVCVFGEIIDDDSEVGGGGVWRIRHGINPELVGCHLVGDMDGDALCCSRLHVSEKKSLEPFPSVVEQTLRDDGRKRRWQVVELDGCSLPFS